MVSKETEHSKKRILWGLSMATLMLVGSGQAVIGRGVRPGSDSNARITLRVYNYAISHSLLSDAEGESTVILAFAGLEPIWVDCPLTDGDFEKDVACKRPLGPTEFILKILTKAQSAQFPKGDDELGQALDCPKGPGGCSAYIFYSDVRNLARAGDVPEFRLLGHVLAHEIGHLLLGPKSHSATGIMQAEWSDQALQTIARGCLYFTKRQSRRIRDEMLAWSTTQQAR
jgi:hypothetical protein